MRNRNTVQIKTEISRADVRRLDNVVGWYRFKSRYQLLRALVYQFLKYADPKEDEFVPQDIEEMFGELEEGVSRHDFQDTKRGRSV